MWLPAFASIVSAVVTLQLAFVKASTETQLCFPDGFLLGTATAAYQVEGAWNEGGRSPSIWDDFCRSHAGLACADVAVDFYHRYASDIELMKRDGHSTFRFSISWSRVMHWDETTQRMTPNPVGLAFYHKLIDKLSRQSIVPIITLYHYDLPSELHTKLSPPSWLNPKISDHFEEYAALLYKEYGTKVALWETFNEPLTLVLNGYGLGAKAPGMGHSTTNTYVAGHNVLVAHGKAVRKLRELKVKNVVRQDARISIALSCDYAVPADPSNGDDVAAVERTLQFSLGWFLSPLVTGEYPAVMRQSIGDRLPQFTPEEAALVKDSYDLFMLNHYSTHTVTRCDSPRAKTKCTDLSLGWERDLGLDYTGIPVGALRSGFGSNGKHVEEGFAGVPSGFREVLRWMHAHNTSTEILVTENGYCGDARIENKDQLWYHQSYLEQLHHALVEDKIPIIGYIVWSLLDNYEWGTYEVRYGLYHIAYPSQAGSKTTWTPKSTDLARLPRPAAKWFAQVAISKCMHPAPSPDKMFTAKSIVTHRAPPSFTPSTSWNSGVVLGGILVACIAFFATYRHRTIASNEQTPLLRVVE